MRPEMLRNIGIHNHIHDLLPTATRQYNLNSKFGKTYAGILTVGLGIIKAFSAAGSCRGVGIFEFFLGMTVFDFIIGALNIFAAAGIATGTNGTTGSELLTRRNGLPAR